MRIESEKKLEELIHRELSKLPPREAPETLIPRVMQAIQARGQRKWWQRPWTQWPLGLQIVSLPVMCLAAAAIATGLSLAGELQFWQSAASTARLWLDSLAPILNLAIVLLHGCAVALGAISPYWYLLIAGAALIWGTFLGLGTVCFRLASSRR